MAQKIITTLIDDLDGGEAVEVVHFALDGVTYEIDLNAENADRLRDIFQPYVDNARRAGNGAARRTSKRSPARGQARARFTRGTTSSGAAAAASVVRSPSVPPPGRDGRELREAIRERARAAGVPVSTRGRLSQDVIERFGAQV